MNGVIFQNKPYYELDVAAKQYYLLRPTKKGQLNTLMILKYPFWIG